MYILAFEKYLSYEKRYSEHTVKAYLNDLYKFTEYLKFQYSISDITKADFQMIRSWVSSLLEENTSEKTIKRNISSLKAFYRYSFKKDWIKIDPTQKVITPKVKERLPFFLTQEQTEQLLKNLDDPKTYIENRDRLVIILLYATGIRRHELVKLQVEDISFSKNNIKVIGKRNKERQIPLGDAVLSECKKYLEIRAEFINKNNISSSQNSLFLTIKGNPLYDRAVHNIVHNNLVAISTNKKLSPHILRHTFATQLLNQDADINAIKELLGHSSLSSTQIYTHNSIDKLKSIHKQAHPRA